MAARRIGPGEIFPLRVWSSAALTLAIAAVTTVAAAGATLPLLRRGARVEAETAARLVSVFATTAASTSVHGASPEELAAWSRGFEAIRVAAGVDIALLTETDGTLLVQSPAEDLSPEALEGVERCRSGLADGQASERVSLDQPDDVPLIAACAPILDGMGIRVGELTAVTRASWFEGQAARRDRAGLLLMELAAIIGLLVILTLRTVLDNVEESAEAAERMAGGERGVRLRPRGTGELRRLAAALNSLGNAVEVREDEVRSRLGVVTQLTGMVAHEVRNPLQSLSLLATLARTERDPEEREKLLSSIETEIHVLEGVVQKFLRTSGPLQITRTGCDLIEVINRTLALVEPQAHARGVRLTTRLPDRLALTVDSSLVRRAIENLLLNAVEFAGQEPPGHVTVTLTRRDRTAFLTVDDNGQGVRPQERDRIFQAYFSSKSGGTGLGLALVKQVFEAHGGSIRCEDSPIGGARFTATLPIEEASEVPFAD